MPSERELLPCPWCGSHDLYDDGYLREMADGERDRAEFISCNDCNAQGPSAPYSDIADDDRRIREAYEAWNTRRDPEVERDALEARLRESEQECAGLHREMAGAWDALRKTLGPQPPPVRPAEPIGEYILRTLPRRALAPRGAGAEAEEGGDGE